MAALCNVRIGWLAVGCLAALFAVDPASTWGQKKPGGGAPPQRTPVQRFDTAQKPQKLGQSAPGIPTGPRLGQSTPGIVVPQRPNFPSAPAQPPRINFTPSFNPLPGPGAGTNFRPQNNFVPSGNVVVPGNNVPTFRPNPTFVPGSPANTVPSNTVPGLNLTNNTPIPPVRANEIDIPVEPMGNEVSDQVYFRFTEEQQNELLEDMRKAEQDQAASFDGMFQNIVFTDPATRAKFKDALAQVDPDRADAIDQTLQKMPIDLTKLKEQLQGMPDAGNPAGIRRDAAIMDIAKLTNSSNDYKKAVADGASSADILTKAEQVRSDYQIAQARASITGGSAAFNDTLNKNLDQQVNLAKMREKFKDSLQISNANNGGAAIPSLIDAGNSVVGPGQTLLVNSPHLESEVVVVLSPDTVVQGVGNAGAFAMSVEDRPNLAGIPFIPGKPLPVTDPANVVTSGIVLLNPEDTGGAISYSLNGESCSMEPGYSQNLGAGKTWLLEFDRGNGADQARYELKGDATYEFGIDPAKKAWDIWKKTYKVTLDNSRNGKDFHLVFNGEQMTVRAKKGLQLESTFPIVATFDQGKGGPAAVRRLTSGAYQVGVTRTGLDIFPPRTSATAAAAPPAPTPAPAPVKSSDSKDDSGRPSLFGD